MHFKKIVLITILIILTVVLKADFITKMEKRILTIYDELAPNVVEIEVELKKEKKITWGFSTDKIAGCGLILGDNNYIVTNYHISDKTNIKSIKINFTNSEDGIEARLVGSDERNDLALLQVDSIPYEVNPIKWGNIEKVKVGQFVTAIGDPLGLDKTITFGLISKVKRDLYTYEVNPFIQSDLNIDSGSSGGPLINMDGEVIGINNKRNSFAFSIPVDIVLESIEKMKKGDVLKPYFGIDYEPLDDYYREFFQNDSLNGVLVEGFNYQSPAQDTDVKAGDIIIAVNDNKIDGELDKSGVYYRRFINESKIGNPATLSIWRFGKEHQVSFPVIEEPERKMRHGYECDNWGLITKELTKKIIYNYDLKQCKPGQMAIEELEHKNNIDHILDEGDILVGFVKNNKTIPINNIDNLIDIYEENKEQEYVMFKVIRDDKILYPIIKKIDNKIESLEK